MGSLFGGGSKADDLQQAAQWREVEATQKQDALVAKQEEERTQLKGEEDATKQQVEDRRRRLASGVIGRRSLFSNDETGFAMPTRTLGAS